MQGNRIFEAGGRKFLRNVTSDLSHTVWWP